MMHYILGYDVIMRTTVDLPNDVRQRVQALADDRRQSLSATIAELAVYGLAQLEEPREIVTDERSGFPVMRLGRPVTSDDVAALLDDE
jgi:predicted transcriptional regulator